MTGEAQTHNIAAIHALLVAAFTPEDLRRFCRDRPAFRPVLANFSPKHSLNDMVDRVITYCETRALLDQLLAELEQANPDQSARFESELKLPPGTAPIPVPERRPGAPYQPPRPFPDFVGRTAELRYLDDALKPGAKTAITGLVGMGGLGKPPQSHGVRRDQS